MVAGTSLFTGAYPKKSIGSGSDPESQAGRQSDDYGGWCLELRHLLCKNEQVTQGLFIRLKLVIWPMNHSVRNWLKKPIIVWTRLLMSRDFSSFSQILVQQTTIGIQQPTDLQTISTEKWRKMLQWTKQQRNKQSLITVLFYICKFI